MRTLAALFLLAAPAFAQFQLMVVEGQTERVSPALYDLGAVYPNEPASVRFRLRNTSSSPATVTTLTVAGSGFSLTAGSARATLAPQGALDFTVGFSAGGLGSYSAALRSDGISILLTVEVVPRLTLTGGLDFGSVVRGSSVPQRFTLTNLTPQALIVPAISVQGADYSLEGTPPSGQLYQPQQSGGFTIVFAPRATGLSQGTLTIGDRSFTLTGAGADPPLPKPFLAVDLKQIGSAQQGLAIILFDTPVKTSGSGSLTLEFRGPGDPTITLAFGSRTYGFTVAPGDTRVTVPFQTGTTAGTIIFTAQLGSYTDQLSIPIPSTPAVIASTQGTRTGSSAEVVVTGFDNTHTLGALSFTFYDSGGNVLGPGAIRADAGVEFAKFFSASNVGGAFLFRAVFPVTGDVSRIAAFDVTLTNSAGTTKTPRITM